MSARNIFTVAGRYAVSLFVLILGWSALVRLTNLPAYLLPNPFDVLSTLSEEREQFTEAAAITFTNAIIGGTIGVLIGMVIGGIAAFSRKVRWLIEPYLTVFQSFPREAFLPLIVVWLGFGMAPKIINAILLSSLPMAVIMLNSLTDTRDEYLKLMESWRSSRHETFFLCQLPAAVPQIVGGVRVAMPLALIGAVLGEFLGGSGGLGYIIVSSGSAFRVDRIFAAIIVLAVGGTLIVASIDFFRFSFLKRFYQSSGGSLSYE